MRKRKIGRKFGRRKDSRKAFLSAIVQSIIQHGRVKTTEARAKEVQPLVERAITIGKKQTLAARRRLERLYSTRVARAIMDDVAPRFQNRAGGYVRIVKLGARRGDRAPMALVEFVDRGNKTKKE